VAGLILSLLDLIPGFSLLCFPALCTWLTSALTLLAFIIDLILFYIARARINAVSGATATIGACVWLTLAAWVTTAVAGCVFGLGRCCAAGNRRGQRRNREERKYEAMKQDADASREFQPDTFAGKRQGPPVLPVKQEEEVSVPLTATDKYDDDDDQTGSVPYHQPSQTVDGVGYGYGQRYPPQPPRHVTPTDRGYVPSSSAYQQQQPFPAQDTYTDPYAARQGTEYLAQPAQANGYPTQPQQNATYSPPTLVPGLPPNAGRMTPASTYAGSFVGVGSGRHEGLPGPLPVGAAAAVAGYAQARGSGYEQRGSGYELQQARGSQYSGQQCEFCLVCQFFER
jgi:hypothetical protein